MNAPSTSPPPPRPWLVADIGGTHARFGWLGEGEARPGRVRTLAGCDHADPASAARAYLAGIAQQEGEAYRAPQAAALAVATAVVGDRVELTNSGWSFSRRALQSELGLDCLLVLNDFEALALSLPGLAASQLRPIGPGPRAAGPTAASGPSTAGAAGAAMAALAARAVIGPGTGLGVAGLAWGGARWVALPGEGGHASLAPADEFESALLAVVRREFDHVSAERLLSGIGLPVLHRAVAAVQGIAAEPLAAAEIVERGLAGSDALAARTLDQFCALLGGFAGNVALTLGARGGVYIGGGIVPRLGDAFAASRFRDRFEAKGRFATYLRAIPTWVITDTLAALGGAAAALAAPATAHREG